MWHTKPKKVRFLPWESGPGGPDTRLGDVAADSSQIQDADGGYWRGSNMAVRHLWDDPSHLTDMAIGPTKIVWKK